MTILSVQLLFPLLYNYRIIVVIGSYAHRLLYSAKSMYDYSTYRIAGNFSEIETLTIFASRHENMKV